MARAVRQHVGRQHRVVSRDLTAVDSADDVTAVFLASADNTDEAVRRGRWLGEWPVRQSTCLVHDVALAAGERPSSYPACLSAVVTALIEALDDFGSVSDLGRRTVVSRAHALGRMGGQAGARREARICLSWALERLLPVAVSAARRGLAGLTDQPGPIAGVGDVQRVSADLTPLAGALQSLSEIHDLWQSAGEPVRLDVGADLQDWLGRLRTGQFTGDAAIHLLRADLDPQLVWSLVGELLDRLIEEPLRGQPGRVYPGAPLTWSSVEDWPPWLDFDERCKHECPVATGFLLGPLTFALEAAAEPRERPWREADRIGGSPAWRRWSRDGRRALLVADWVANVLLPKALARLFEPGHALHRLITASEIADDALAARLAAVIPAGRAVRLIQDSLASCATAYEIASDPIAWLIAGDPVELDELDDPTEAYHSSLWFCGRFAALAAAEVSIDDDRLGEHAVAFLELLLDEP